MNYDKKGNIKELEYDDITDQEERRDSYGNIQYKETVLNAGALLSIINDLIKEINELRQFIAH